MPNYGSDVFAQYYLYCAEQEKQGKEPVSVLRYVVGLL